MAPEPPGPATTTMSALPSPSMSPAATRMPPAKPLGRVGVPDDVARVVLFCASDLSSLMTGTTLVVDAGDLA